jgi:hypothetical protein
VVLRYTLASSPETCLKIRLKWLKATLEYGSPGYADTVSGGYQSEALWGPVGIETQLPDALGIGALAPAAVDLGWGK